MSEQYVDRGPSRVGQAIAILAAAVAVGLVAEAPTQRIALAIEVAGLLAVTAGIAVSRRGFTIIGSTFKLFGAIAITAAILLGVVQVNGVTERLEFLPGAVGVSILGWGLLPVGAAGSRRKVAIGVAAVVAGTIISGVMHGSTLLELLGSIVAAIVAWDAGEGAIALGEQVGRDADTTRVELVHSVATVSVGGAGIVLARAVHDLNVTGLPLAGLLALLAAAVVLATVLYA